MLDQIAATGHGLTLGIHTLDERLAVMHALAFWFSVGLLTPLVLLVGLLTYRKQLLHDLLLGVVALNADALRRRDKPIIE